MAMRAAVQSRRGGDSPHQLYINNGELQDPRARAQGENGSTPNIYISPIPPEFTDENALAGDAAESEAVLVLRHPC